MVSQKKKQQKEKKYETRVLIKIAFNTYSASFSHIHVINNVYLNKKLIN